MSPQSRNPETEKRLESAHVCPKCGFVLNLAEIDLKAATIGIVICPRCELSGPIEIQIVEHTASSDPASS